MDDINLKKIRESLNTVEFTGCEGIRIGDILNYPAKFSSGYRFQNMLGAFRRIVMRTLFQSYDFERRGKGEILFLLSDDEMRPDHYVNFCKMVSVCSNSIEMKFSGKFGKMHLSYIKYLPLCFRWYSQMKTVQICVCHRWIYVAAMYAAYLAYQEQKEELARQGIRLKALVSWCDVMTADSFLTQMMNRKGIRTLTAQHGVYSSGFDDWLFQGSHSDGMLAANQYSVKEAEITGYTGKSFRTGMPGSIGKPVMVMPEHFYGHTIGLFLDNEENHDANLEMLAFMVQFCEKSGRALYVKVHPSGTEMMSEYKKCGYGLAVKKIYGTDITLDDFAKLIDVAVVRYSTCLIQMLELWIPAFSFYSDRYTRDAYKNVPFEIRFSTDEKLERLLEEICKDNYKVQLKQIRDYFYIEHAYENYRNVFDRLEKKQD